MSMFPSRFALREPDGRVVELQALSFAEARDIARSRARIANAIIVVLESKVGPAWVPVADVTPDGSPAPSLLDRLEAELERVTREREPA